MLQIQEKILSKEGLGPLNYLKEKTAATKKTKSPYLCMKHKLKVIFVL